MGEKLRLLDNELPMRKDWRVVSCSNCRGYGMVSVYSYNDFEGAGECSECGGTGRLWILPTGHIFQYPGGPARGSWPGAYNEAIHDCRPLEEEQ